MIPGTISGLLEYATSHKNKWEQVLQQIGVSQAAVDELASVLDTAEIQRALSVAAQESSKSAVLAQNDALDTLRKELAKIQKTIVAHAANSPNPKAVYSAADLPFPKTRAELPPPVSPTNLSAQTNVRGEIELKWDGVLENGTYFRIERQTFPLTGTPSIWTLLDTTESKTWNDLNVPIGLKQVSYRITARRNDEVSDNSVEVNVPFGNPNQTIVTGTEVASEPVTEAA